MEVKNQFELVGYVDVDAGLIWVGDPCYVITDPDEPRPVDLGANWSGFCQRLFGRQEKGVGAFGHREGGSGMGLAISTLYGDGSYPVYVEYDPHMKRPRRVIIDFDAMGVEDEA